MDRSVSGIVLAGGANSRFGGRVKSNIIVDGKTIISGILEKLSLVFDEIIVVTNSPEEFAQYNGIRLSGDFFRNAGPLGGIHSGMKVSSGESIFVFAGDMPFPDTGIIEKQIERWRRNPCEILVPRTGENIEPLHSIYSNSLLQKLEKYLSEGNSHPVREFYKLADVEYFDIEDTEEFKRAFTNINNPSDLEKLNTIRRI